MVESSAKHGRSGLSERRCYRLLVLLPTRCVVLVSAAAALWPATANAHAFIADPPSRDTAITNLDDRAHKTGPCGGSPRIGMPTRYAVGASVDVDFTETIGHRGCFQVLFSPANDADWVLLQQIDDPAGPFSGEPAKSYTAKVTLPAGVTCESCTLAVRQLMKGAACAPNATPSGNDTYYSCADIRVGDFADAGPSRPPTTPADGGTASTPSADPETEPDDTPASGGSRRVSSTADAGGCNAGGGHATLPVLALAASAIALAWQRRRR